MSKRILVSVSFCALTVVLVAFLIHRSNNQNQIQKQLEEARQQRQAMPEYAICTVALEEAKSFPGLPNGTEENVRKKLAEDPVQALTMLQKLVYDGLSAHMEKQDYDPKNPQHRRGWENNNHSTCRLLVEYPYAKRAGKLQELADSVRDRGKRDIWWEVIEGKDRGRSYEAWFRGAIWPFTGENAPTY